MKYVVEGAIQSRSLETPLQGKIRIVRRFPNSRVTGKIRAGTYNLQNQDVYGTHSQNGVRTLLIWHGIRNDPSAAYLYFLKEVSGSQKSQEYNFMLSGLQWEVPIEQAKYLRRHTERSNMNGMMHRLKQELDNPQEVNLNFTPHYSGASETYETYLGRTSLLDFYVWGERQDKNVMKEFTGKVKFSLSGRTPTGHIIEADGETHEIECRTTINGLEGIIFAHPVKDNNDKKRVYVGGWHQWNEKLTDGFKYVGTWMELPNKKADKLLQQIETKTFEALKDYMKTLRLPQQPMYVDLSAKERKITRIANGIKESADGMNKVSTIVTLAQLCI